MSSRAEIDERISELVAKLSGADITEIGAGLVAQGLFRETRERGVRQAAANAGAVVSAFTGMHLDLVRNVSKLSGEPMT